MDIPRRKPRLDLPYDCHKLKVEDCTASKYDGKCLIKSGRFGGSDLCVPNEEYILDKEIRDKGFKNFNKIDEENLSSELSRRQDLCNTLSMGACNSAKAKVFGCQYKRKFLGKGNCQLSDKIINYYLKTSSKCLCESCNEQRGKGFLLCNEHRYEFEEMLEVLNSLHKEIMEGKNLEENYTNFVNIYGDIVNRFNGYFMENQATLVQLTEKYNAIRKELNEQGCQCVNVKSCIGKGKVANFCENKANKTDFGLICKEHQKCIKDRKVKLEKLKENFQTLCGVKNCKKELDELQNFYRMIMFTTEGKVSIYKNEVLEYLFIIKRYIKELS